MKRQIANRISIVWFAIRDNLRSWRYWASRPDNEFTRNGYAVIADFLDRAECGRVRERPNGTCRGLATWWRAIAIRG